MANPLAQILQGLPLPSGEQIQGFFDNPHNRSAMAQFGAQLLQPLPLGQTTGGSIGAALGSGLEARDRSQQRAEKRQDKEDAKNLAERRLAKRGSSTGAENRAFRAREKEKDRAFRREMADRKLSLTTLLRKERTTKRDQDRKAKFIADNMLAEPGATTEEKARSLAQKWDAANAAARPQKATPNITTLREQAFIALRQGANSEAVRQKFRALTGQELE